MKKIAILSVIIATLCGCDKGAELAKSVENVDLKQVSELTTTVFANTVKAQCQGQLQNDDDDDDDDNNGVSVVDLVLTAEQRTAACDCVATEVQNTLSAEKIQTMLKDGMDTKAIGEAISASLNTCVASVNQKSS